MTQRSAASTGAKVAPAFCPQGGSPTAGATTRLPAMPTAGATTKLPATLTVGATARLPATPTIGATTRPPVSHTRRSDRHQEWKRGDDPIVSIEPRASLRSNKPMLPTALGSLKINGSSADSGLHGLMVVA